MPASACASCHPRQVAEWRRSVMAHSGKSPLFQSLEMLIEEQIGKSFACPGGAGILRAADPLTACRSQASNLPITGSGGALWCVNCHTPGENLAAAMPAWNSVAQVFGQPPADPAISCPQTAWRASRARSATRCTGPRSRAYPAIRAIRSGPLSPTVGASPCVPKIAWGCSESATAATRSTRASCCCRRLPAAVDIVHRRGPQAAERPGPAVPVVERILRRVPRRAPDRHRRHRRSPG